tara:strand:- start:1753 stop:3186 length:1434 start_codon:yes stop_codon:yes gene_type:complete
MTQPVTVFVSGVFDVLHPGHLRLLRFARELGDRLIVGVLSDDLAGDIAHVSQDLRLEGVKANSFVSEALLVDTSLENTIDRLRPNYVVKGKEYEHQSNVEPDVLDKYGGKLVFSSGEAIFSSLDLIRKELTKSYRTISNEPTDFLVRHGIDLVDLVSKVRDIHNLQICVIGDLIVDEYITCDPLGMSHEDPTLVVTTVDTQRFLGGSGIVAGHAAGLGAKVHHLSISGKDDTRDYAYRELQRLGLDVTLLGDNVRPTTLKKRYRAEKTTLLRVSHLHQGAIDAGLQDQLLEKFREVLPDCQLVVFSDYNYGCLPQTLVEKLIKLSEKHDVMMVADSQSSSQIGDVSRFRGMHLLTPTEHEARVSLRNHEDGLVVLAEQLRVRSKARNIILKLGREGALLLLESDQGEPQTDRIPALNLSPQDASGAGDALLVASAMLMAVGATPWEAAYVGTVASAVQVGRIGNIPLTQADLLGEIM